MPLDKKMYNEMKNHISHLIRHPPWCYEGTLQDWILSYRPMIEQYIEEENYEAAKAICDAIKEFLNEHLEEDNKIPEWAILKLK